MNTLVCKNKTLATLSTIFALAMPIVSCGGGGSDSTSPVATITPTPTPAATPVTTEATEPTTQEYAPDPAKLTLAAQTSDELYVAESFTFSHYQMVSVDITTADSNGNPLVHQMLAVSVIDDEIEAYDDPRLQEKRLLTYLKTDSQGRITRDIEMPTSVNKVLLELNAVGVDNDVITTINAMGAIEHHFSQNQ